MSSNYYPANRLVESIGRTVLRLLGWNIEGQLPRLNKYVAIVGYHTSNWDFVVLIAAKMLLRLHARWYAKHTLFRWPQGILFRSWGGIPIVRHKTRGVVEQAVDAFQGHEYFVLGLSPEGTRSLTDGWKEGFYHIARGAGVPIVPVALDYQRKALVIGDPRQPMADYSEQVTELIEFYNQFPPKYPKLAWKGGGPAPNESRK
ncbi:1-acyl-sn-glycerol-3-phosphate acyltransferase [Aestuariirhabdus sp. Z084]|uniref:1-acyl-sn-glycerol-3-phosphate acyltransferase n=1 Tax=Aestuariirhabdus haliotis TaxID=2918751 RepID=UPI0020BE0EE6|nr:1-acyl-sn-glycerol-3-phosphate acyltransferase [Aestuariirhabdus haliotis]MCL6414182.1 1-acyl-sn-glycerol-3-phosphate acyltransferase [Aestuariirhabdus haliotis]